MMDEYDMIWYNTEEEMVAEEMWPLV